MALATGTALALAGAANLVGGEMGRRAAQSDKDKAAAALQGYNSQLNAISLPDTEKMKLLLEKYQSAGTLAPQQEIAQQLSEQDALQDIQLDPRLRQTKMNQLEMLQKLGDTSFTPDEQAKLNSMRRQVEGDNTSRMRSMLEDQSRRGVGSSEAALAARMIAGQGAANRAGQDAEAMAGQAFQRALQAKQGAGELAGQIENTDYSRASELARALNSREAANVASSANVQQRNIDRFNTAQASNLANAQNTMNMNTGLSNQQQQYNRGLEQTAFENKLAKQGRLGTSATNLSRMYDQNAADTAKMYQGVGAGVGQMIGAGSMMGGGAKPMAAAGGDMNTSMPVYGDTDMNKLKKFGGMA